MTGEGCQGSSVDDPVFRNFHLLGRLHSLGAWPTISFQVAIKHTNTNTVTGEREGIR
jgi:hypothetical protein